MFTLFSALRHMRKFVFFWFVFNILSFIKYCVLDELQSVSSIEIGFNAKNTGYFIISIINYI